MEWFRRLQSRSPAEAVRRGVTAASEFVTKELGPAAQPAEETPDVAMQNVFRFHKTGRFPIGESLARGVWACTEPKQHLLAVAPTQSHAGKTSGIIIPHILAHPGPVVAVTTKADVFPATAMVRAQAGRLWCYCPDGVTDHIPEGATELRWSPIKGAGEWDVAIRTARTMVTVVDTASMRHGSHWQSRAGDLLAPIFHWAVKSHKTMRQARDAVYDHATSLPAIERWLTENNAPAAGAMLRSVIHAAPAELASIASTAAGALAAYSTEAAMRTTDDENFDIADFVNGGTGSVCADTIYIAPTTGSQRELAPLIVGLLSQIQAAAYQRQRKIVRNELVGHPAAGPILFALDELYGLAPMPDLPHILSEGGSQGIHVTAAVQDLTLIASRWPDEAASFMTLFGHILIYPGIRDDATLQKVSGLLGHHDVEKRSETRKNVVTGGRIQDYFAGRKQEWTERVENITYSTEWRPRYEKHDIQTGPVPEETVRIRGRSTG